MSIKKRHVNKVIFAIKRARVSARRICPTAELIIEELQERLFDMCYEDKPTLDEDKFDIACTPSTDGSY